MKPSRYKLFSTVMYMVGIVIILFFIVGKAPLAMVFVALLCISLGGVLSGVAANKEFEQRIAERKRKREERRRNYRDNRRI